MEEENKIRMMGESPVMGCNPVKPERQRLWILTFSIGSTLSKGCAVVKAHDADRAVRVLKADGMYNGVPAEYNITRIEEIIESPDQMLICEEINTVNI